MDDLGEGFGQPSTKYKGRQGGEEQVRRLQRIAPCRSGPGGNGCQCAARRSKCRQSIGCRVRKCLWCWCCSRSRCWDVNISSPIIIVIIITTAAAHQLAHGQHRPRRGEEREEEATADDSSDLGQFHPAAHALRQGQRDETRNEEHRQPLGQDGGAGGQDAVDGISPLGPGGVQRQEGGEEESASGQRRREGDGPGLKEAADGHVRGDQEGGGGYPLDGVVIAGRRSRCCRRRERCPGLCRLPSACRTVSDTGLRCQSSAGTWY
mmetsp:Transcript_24286/g.56948  ORF Transcript_24286/g.56948 Transcript_24286/m.56948 type:complete len:264 (-) Transcript_24286:77-868(-)